MIRSRIQGWLRKLGWEVHRFKPSSSHSAQLITAMNHVEANIVFDIGANEGQFAKEIRSAGFDGTIVSFEPQTDAHRKLVDAAKQDTHWQIHERAAIGNTSGIIEINVSENSVSSSVLPILDAHVAAAAQSAYVNKESVAVRTLDSVASQYLTEESCLFLKVDTQGFEWQVLDGAIELMKLAVGIQLEVSVVPLYGGQRLWREIVDRIEMEGMSLWALQQGFTDSDTGRTLQMDAIFLREPQTRKGDLRRF